MFLFDNGSNVRNGNGNIERWKMTREEAIEILKTDSCVDCGVGSQSSYTCTFDGHCDIKKAMKMAIKALEQEPKWIPVSERLPEEFQRVLVTIVNYNGDKVVRVAEYYNRRGVGVFQVKENHEQWEVGEEGLLAWMPLPKPYKAESEE